MSVFPIPFLGSSPNKSGVISFPPQKRNPSQKAIYSWIAWSDLIRGDKGKPAGVSDRLDISISHKLPIVHEAADNDSDFRFHKHSFFNIG